MSVARSYAHQVGTAPRWDYHWWFPIGLSIALTVSCVIFSGKRYFWFDELFSYFLLSDASFRGMLSAFADKINNSPIFYFATGWLWAQTFGASELSLRLFSSLGMSTAALVTWLVLRRNYGSWPASLTTVLVFALSFLVLRQNVEARMYGLYLALAALAMLQFDRVQRERSCSTAAAVAIACTHAALLHTHLFGIFYSATIVATGALVDCFRSRWQPRVYLAVSAAWLSLLLYIPTFLVQADAGRPRTWIPVPTLGDLAYFYAFELRYVSLVLVVLLAVAVAYCWRPWRDRLAMARSRLDRAIIRDLLNSRPTLVLACLLLLVPVGVWLVSLTVKPIFFNRYLLPSLLGAAVVIAHLLAVLDQATRSGDRRLEWWPVAALGRLYTHPAARTSVLALVLLLPVLASLMYRPGTWHSIAEFDHGYSDLPIVVQFSDKFLRHVHYAPHPERYLYLLDWETAVVPESGTFPPQEYKHMEALLRQYPERFAGQIVASEAFLAEHDRFLVFDYAEYDYACEGAYAWYHLKRNLARWQHTLQCPRWLEERILPDARYRVTQLGHFGGGGFVMLSVELAQP